MDVCFSKRELSWLDDLMPESKKKRLDDAQIVAEQAEQVEVSRFMYCMYVSTLQNLIVRHQL